MDLDSYRAGLIAWRDEALARVGGGTATLELQKRNGEALRAAGLAGPDWPSEYGGVGGSDEHAAAFEEIVGPTIQVTLPPQLVTFGVCAPTLRDFGTEEQKRRHLPAILAGSAVWAQLLSEPGAGSDLASVSTRARRVDGGWSLTGQKVWTSRADIADHALAFVRTSDPDPADRRAGFSMLIVDMSAAGVDVRPLREMTGEAIFNEVFLDDVFVPDKNLVGEEGDGWRVLLGMLSAERDSVGATSGVNTIYRGRADELRRRAAALDPTSRHVVQHDLVRFVAREKAHLALVEAVAAVRRESQDPRPFGSLSKISLAQLSVMASDLATRLEGMTVRSPADGVGALSSVALLRSPMAGIAGGTTEVQKNTISRQILRLDGGRSR